LEVLGNEQNAGHRLIDAVEEVKTLHKVAVVFLPDERDNLARIGTLGQIAEAFEQGLADVEAVLLPRLEVGRDLPDGQLGKLDFLVELWHLRPRLAEFRASLSGLRLEALLRGQRGRGEQEDEYDEALHVIHPPELD